MAFSGQLKKLFIVILLAGFFSVTHASNSNDDVIDGVEEAISFWEGRSGQVASEKVAYFEEILAVLNGGDIPEGLMEDVTNSWNKASPGGKFYTMWKGVYERLKALDELASVEEVPNQQNQEQSIPEQQEQQEQQEQSIPDQQEQEEPPQEVEQEDPVINGVEEAISFWEGRSGQMASEKVAYFQEILAVLNGGDIPEGLMEDVTNSWNKASPGGKFYTMWKGVYERLKALDEVASVEEVPAKNPPKQPAKQQDQQQDQQQDPPPDLVVLNSDQLVLTAPAWYDPPIADVERPTGKITTYTFNPGGGYVANDIYDGYEGYYRRQDGITASGITNKSLEEDLYDHQGNLVADGIPDWEYISYYDAASQHGLAKQSWGPWDSLDRTTQKAIAGIIKPTDEDIESVLGICAGCETEGFVFPPANNPNNFNTGTATYKGNAEGVFRPDLFGVIYGTKDDPNTKNIYEQDDGGPRVELTVNFDTSSLDGNLSARRPFTDIRRTTDNLVPYEAPVLDANGQAIIKLDEHNQPMTYQITDANGNTITLPVLETETKYRNQPISKTYLDDYKNAYLRLYSDAISAELSRLWEAYKANNSPEVWAGQLTNFENMHRDQVRKELNLNYGDLADHNEDLDKELRSAVVRWNGIKIGKSGEFEGQGLYGEISAQCSNNNYANSNACATADLVDPSKVITGYINHPRFVGSYGATKCNGSNCPGFAMPDLEPVVDMNSWGPWDDLPQATRQSIVDLPTPDSLVMYREPGWGWSLPGNPLTSHLASPPIPTTGTARWRGTVHGVRNPNSTPMTNPKIQLNADFSNATLSAGIYYHAQQHGHQWVDSEIGERWNNIPLTGTSFDHEGLTGQMYRLHIRYGQNGEQSVFPAGYRHHSIIGTINHPDIVGVYRADK